MSQGKGFGGVARANLMVSMATYFQKPEIFGFENHPGTMGRREGRRSMIRRSYIFTEELNALTLGKVLATFPPPPSICVCMHKAISHGLWFLQFFGSSVLPFFRSFPPLGVGFLSLRLFSLLFSFPHFPLLTFCTFHLFHCFQICSPFSHFVHLCSSLFTVFHIFHIALSVDCAPDDRGSAALRLP